MCRFRLVDGGNVKILTRCGSDVLHWRHFLVMHGGSNIHSAQPRSRLVAMTIQNAFDIFFNLQCTLISMIYSKYNGH